MWKRGPTVQQAERLHWNHVFPRSQANSAGRNWESPIPAPSFGWKNLGLKEKSQLLKVCRASCIQSWDWHPCLSLFFLHPPDELYSRPLKIVKVTWLSQNLGAREMQARCLLMRIHHLGWTCCPSAVSPLLSHPPSLSREAPPCPHCRTGLPPPTSSHRHTPPPLPRHTASYELISPQTPGPLPSGALQPCLLLKSFLTWGSSDSEAGEFSLAFERRFTVCAGRIT